MPRRRLLLIMLILAILTTFLFMLNSHNTPQSEKTDFPPFILIGETYYKCNGQAFDHQPEDSIYFGAITSTVPGNEMPLKSFQANDSIEGAPIYYTQNQLFVCINNKWWEYLEYSTTD